MLFVMTIDTLKNDTLLNKMHNIYSICAQNHTKRTKGFFKKKNCLSNEVYIWQNVFVKVLSAAQDLPDLLWIKLYNEKFILKFTDIS